jgi:hypothetical protein
VERWTDRQEGNFLELAKKAKQARQTEWANRTEDNCCQWITVNQKKIKIQAKILSNLDNPPSNRFLLHLLKKEAQPPFDLQVVGVLRERTQYQSLQ